LNFHIFMYYKVFLSGSSNYFGLLTVFSYFLFVSALKFMYAMLNRGFPTESTRARLFPRWDMSHKELTWGKTINFYVSQTRWLRQHTLQLCNVGCLPSCSIIVYRLLSRTVVPQYHQSQKNCSLSYFSNLSNFKTGRDSTKKHSIKSIDRANIYRIQFVLFCCMSFHSQVMKVWKKWEEAISLPLMPTSNPKHSIT